MCVWIMASCSSEKKPFGKGATLKSQAREFIYRLRVYFERERNNGGPLIPVSKVTDRVAEALNISTATVKRVTNDKEAANSAGSPVVVTPGKSRKRLCRVTETDNFDENAIRRHIYAYYSRKEYPTLKKLTASLSESGLFKGKSTSLSIVLKKIGFRWKKFSGRKVLMERGDIVAWRCRFLRELVSVNPEKVVWIDETWVNVRHARSVAWTDDTRYGTMSVPTGKGGRLIIVHAGSMNGFVPGAMMMFQSKKTVDYHEEMNADKFKDWFVTRLLPNVSPGSVFVMDNAPYHSVQLNKAPTSGTRKDEMVNWLNRNNIRFEENMRKAELLELVRRYKPQKTQYEIDSLAENHGHKVIRLPPYHCHFNAIELIWAQIKTDVAERNKSFTLRDTERLVNEAVTRITPQTWKNVVNHVWKDITRSNIEEGVREESMENFVIALSGEEESSSEDSEDCVVVAREEHSDDDDLGVSVLLH